ncbi:MAG: hypothetical protein HOC23_07475 [Halieaceae bacterium]|jgi:hypothetical protein|nr:hypothetical protein [Halieaceae bacterium]
MKDDNNYRHPEEPNRRASPKARWVSLGGGCDVATELLQRRGLSDTSHFFDYLWNLDGGLNNVSRIIASRFAGFDSQECFIRLRHPEWNTAEVAGSLRIACADLEAEQLCHRDYPDIVFLHYREGAELVDKLSRKAERFMQLLEGNGPLTFIYYRQYHGPILGQYINKPNYDIDDKLCHWQTETEKFVQFLTGLYPLVDFRIVSCFMGPHTQLPGVNDVITEYISALGDTDRINWRQVTRRGGPSGLLSWDALYDEYCRDLL